MSTKPARFRSVFPALCIAPVAIVLAIVLLPAFVFGG